MWYAFTVYNIHTSTHCYYMLRAMQNACMSRIEVIKLPSGDDDSFFPFFLFSKPNRMVLASPRPTAKTCPTSRLIRHSNRKKRLE